MAMVVFTLGLFIHNFNYLFMDSHGVIFHSNPQLLTHSATKYLNEILRLTKSCSGGKKDPSILCESTEGPYKLNWAWYSNVHLNIKLTLQDINSNSSCFSRHSYQEPDSSTFSIGSQLIDRDQLFRAFPQSMKILPNLGSVAHDHRREITGVQYFLNCLGDSEFSHFSFPWGLLRALKILMCTEISPKEGNIFHTF